MSSYTTEISSFLQRYQLREDNVTLPVSSIHLQKIRCLKWRFLPAVLEMENPSTVVNDIERGGRPEDEMRATFFSQWRSEKGSDANYKALIRALLVINCKQDAESICELLRNTANSSQVPSGEYYS